MSTSNDTQYRPVSAQDTGANSPYTARVVRDISNGVNNYKDKCSHKIISYIWPNDAPFYSVGDTSLITRELVVAKLAPRYIPDGYNEFLVQVQHQRVAGSGTVTWRLRAIDRMFLMPPSTWEFYTFFYYANYWHSVMLAEMGIDADTVEYAEWTTTSDDCQSSYESYQCLTRDNIGNVYLVITAQHSDDDTAARLWSLDVTPTVGT